VEFSEGTYSDGEQFVQLNTTPMPDQYCWPDKMTEQSRLSRFGMTCELLTEQCGKGVLMWYLVGFPVKTYPLLVGGQVLQESDQDSGGKWLELLAKYSPDMSSWRTPQCSLSGEYTEYSGTYPRWGLMLNGGLYQQKMPEHLIRGKGYGLWAITVTMDKLPPKSKEALLREATITRNGRTPGLETMVLKFPTPQASDNRDRGNMSDPSIQRRIGMGKQIGLSTSVKPDAGGGSLNPYWVEWLMGWPIGWTDLQPLGTDKFLLWQQQHGIS